MKKCKILKGMIASGLALSIFAGTPVSLQAKSGEEDWSNISEGVQLFQDLDLTSKDMLQEMYDSLLELEEGDLEPGLYTLLQKALEDTADILDNPQVTEEEITNAIMNLYAIMIADDVDMFIDTLHEVLADGNPGFYVEESWSAFTKEIQNAIQVMENPASDQQAIVQAIQKVLNAPEKLQMARDFLLEMLNESLTDEAKDNYTKESWAQYEAAIKKAIQIVENPASTNDEITAALDEIETVFDQLVMERAVVIEKLKDTLQYNDEGYFTEESWNVYVDAVQAAIDVLNNSDASQDEVNKALADVDQAYMDLEIDVDLDAAIEELKESLKENKDGIYTKESWAAYEKAVYAVIDVLQGEEIDEDTLLEAYDAMEDAYENLILAEKQPEVKPEKPNDGGNDSDHTNKPQTENTNTNTNTNKSEKETTKNPVKTGDTTHTNALAGTLLISGLVAGATWLKRKKETGC